MILEAIINDQNLTLENKTPSNMYFLDKCGEWTRHSLSGTSHPFPTALFAVPCSFSHQNFSDMLVAPFNVGCLWNLKEDGNSTRRITASSKIHSSSPSTKKFQENTRNVTRLSISHHSLTSLNSGSNRLLPVGPNRSCSPGPLLLHSKFHLEESP